MCYKYATPKLKDLLEHLSEQPPHDIRDYAEYYFADGFNQPLMPVTTNEEPNIIQLAKWPILPNWIRRLEDVMPNLAKVLNAKSETVFELVSFKDHILPRRCLVWVDGFFEWHWNDEKGKSKTPNFIYSKDRKPMTFGGIWNTWTDKETGEVIPRFSIITTAANELLTEIHNNGERMPLIIAPEERERWLSNLTKEEIQEMMKPYPDGLLTSHTISKLITTRGADKNVPEVQEEFIY